MMYYRGTKSNNPMSDWGHAMFTDNKDRAYFSSSNNNAWSYDGTSSVSIESLLGDISSAWDYDRENGFNDQFYADDYWMSVSGSEIAESCNPSDIVDSAGAWDSELVSWIWERILEPRNITAITTNDGAIVFDESLIKSYKKED